MSRWWGAAGAVLGAGAMAAVLLGSSATRTNALDPDHDSAKPATHRTDTGLALDAEVMRRLGVRVEILHAGTSQSFATGFARGLDAGPLAAIEADAESNEAALSASQAEAARLGALYSQDQSASRRALDAARAQARGDAARARLARQRIGLEVGSGLLRLGPGGIRRLVADIAQGRAALVRIDIPGVLLRAGATVEVGEETTRMQLVVLGPAASTDGKLQTNGVLAVVRGPLASHFMAGRILSAQVASKGAARGVIVPRDAILRTQGQLLVYRLDAKGFEAVTLADPQPVADGWFVAAGLQPGERIAISGAASLNALEHRAPAAEGDGD